MTENAREFMEEKGIDHEEYKMDVYDILSDHSKHTLRSLIHFLEANEKKPIRSIIEGLRGRV